jgi:hypothetical protein
MAPLPFLKSLIRAAIRNAKTFTAKHKIRIGAMHLCMCVSSFDKTLKARTF